MANTFKSYQSTGITTQTTVFTGPANTQTTIIGLSVANTSASNVTIDVLLNTAYMIKGATVPVNNSMVIIGGDQKVVIETGDTVKVSSSGTVDVIFSTLEIS